MRKVFMNGSLIDETQAKLSIYDSALMFGDMVFEMTRSFGGTQFKLEEHIDRLLTGIKILRIPIDMSKSELLDACYSVVDANKDFFAPDDEHRLMIDVSRGILGIYHNIDGLHKGSNVIIADFPLRWTVRGMGALYSVGINAVITSQRALPGYLLDPKIKNRSRLFYLMANIEASMFSGDNNWALLLDTDGFIAEGTGDNFFIIKDNQLISPEPRNILRGVSRQYIADTLCQDVGLQFVEKNIEPYDVYTADEALMSGTPFCILPVTSLNGIEIGDGKVGPKFEALLKSWSKNVGVDIRSQIVGWNSRDVAGENNAPTPYQFGKAK